MTLYRLYTERKPGLADLVSSFFPRGFTLYDAIGYRQGRPELSAVIEIITDDPAQILACAQSIARAYGQQSVFVARQSIDFDDVSGDL